MTFLTPTLLAGAAMVALPIVLHLVMRREPQRLEFPALRLVRRRSAANQTRLRLRHWLLLALRCAAVALLAAALARPMLTGPRGAATAGGLKRVALVVDNGPQMGYLQRNRSRLEAARLLASWLTEQGGPGAEWTVADRSAAGGSRRPLDGASAARRVARMAPSANPRPVEACVAEALAGAAGAEPQADEPIDLFLFTDLTAGGLSDAALRGIASRLEALPGATLHLVDVGAESPTNLGLGPLSLSAETLPVGGRLDLSCRVAAVGDPPAEARVELWLEPRAGSGAPAVPPGQQAPVKRGEVVVPLGEGTPAGEARLALTGLEPGTHQGFVRLVGGDPLRIDDQRWFTVRCAEPAPVVVVAKNPERGLFVREALAPSSAQGATGRIVTSLGFHEDWGAALRDAGALWLLDPPPLNEASWRAVEALAQRGGGVALCLGRDAQAGPPPEAAARLLPAGLKWQSRQATYLRPRGYEHPALRGLAEFAETLPWTLFPVHRHWTLEPLAPDALVVAEFAGGDPAIVERRVGTGRVLTVTTPLSDPAHDDPWNLLPTGTDPWPFLLLANSLTDYLTGASDVRLNYAPGETASLATPPGDPLGAFLLKPPGGEAVRQTQPPGQAEVTVGVTDAPGNYRVLAGGASGRLDTGFSVNTVIDPAGLTRRDRRGVLASLPKGRVTLSASRADLARRINLGSDGLDLYPWVITLAAAALAAEVVLANRFYRAAPTGPPGASPAWLGRPA